MEDVLSEAGSRLMGQCAFQEIELRAPLWLGSSSPLCLAPCVACHLSDEFWCLENIAGNGGEAGGVVL